MIMVRAVSGRGVIGRCEPSSPSLNTNRNELHYRFLRIEYPQCELFAYRAGNPRTGEDRDEGEMNSGATQQDDGAPKARHPSTGPGMTVPRLTFAEQLVLWSARRLSAAGLGAAATERDHRQRARHRRRRRQERLRLRARHDPLLSERGAAALQCRDPSLPQSRGVGIHARQSGDAHREANPAATECSSAPTTRPPSARPMPRRCGRTRPTTSPSPCSTSRSHPASPPLARRLPGLHPCDADHRPLVGHPEPLCLRLAPSENARRAS